MTLKSCGWIGILLTCWSCLAGNGVLEFHHNGRWVTTDLTSTNHARFYPDTNYWQDCMSYLGLANHRVTTNGSNWYCAICDGCLPDSQKTSVSKYLPYGTGSYIDMWWSLGAGTLHVTISAHFEDVTFPSFLKGISPWITEQGHGQISLSCSGDYDSGKDPFDVLLHGSWTDISSSWCVHGQETYTGNGGQYGVDSNLAKICVSSWNGD